jgi:hypothetical protein
MGHRQFFVPKEFRTTFLCAHSESLCLGAEAHRRSLGCARDDKSKSRRLQRRFAAGMEAASLAGLRILRLLSE